MNPLNPRSVADHKRYDELISTEFAKQKFWKIQNSLGHYFWSMAQQALEENLKNGGNKCGRFAAIAAARKAKMQHEWRTQLERRREIQNYARSLVRNVEAYKKSLNARDRRLKYIEFKKTFNQVIKVEDFRCHPLRAKRDFKGFGDVVVFPKPLPKRMSLTILSAG